MSKKSSKKHRQASQSQTPAPARAAKRPSARTGARRRATTIGLALVVVAVAVVGWLTVSGSSAATATATATAGAPAGAVRIPERGGLQSVSITANNSFLPGELVARSGAPIELRFGPGSGCAQAVKLPSLGVERSIVGTGGVVRLDDVKPGTYDIYCQSNMDMGTLYVE